MVKVLLYIVNRVRGERRGGGGGGGGCTEMGKGGGKVGTKIALYNALFVLWSGILPSYFLLWRVRVGD